MTERHRWDEVAKKTFTYLQPTFFTNLLLCLFDTKSVIKVSKIIRGPAFQRRFESIKKLRGKLRSIILLPNIKFKFQTSASFN
ncbi:unnamed protein product [Pseudo-nitzschia multistriata]|uniref:Uncharacterized protein n=1 Tax=Pseudo-nitzschia multistriata TaxID=183589 RepID=A0A448ZQH6_9STRA|nr:unnamed protein product [Pseudo-nitzschia multistriata]